MNITQIKEKGETEEQYVKDANLITADLAKQMLFISFVFLF